MSFAVVGHAHRNIFAVNGHPQGARYGGDPHQRSGRDIRLDLFRGLSLIFIFVDHVPDNVLSYLTLQSFSFCDAAEVFIFISGYAAAHCLRKGFTAARFHHRHGPDLSPGLAALRRTHLPVCDLCCVGILRNPQRATSKL
jgi:OpgC protein